MGRGGVQEVLLLLEELLADDSFWERGSNFSLGAWLLVHAPVGEWSTPMCIRQHQLNSVDNEKRGHKGGRETYLKGYGGVGGASGGGQFIRIFCTLVWNCQRIKFGKTVIVMKTTSKVLDARKISEWHDNYSSVGKLHTTNAHTFCDHYNKALTSEW